MPFFALATLTAPVLLALGALWGGLWAVAGLLWMTALAASLDEMVRRVTPAGDGAEFPQADALSVALAMAQLLLLALVVWAVGRPALSTVDKVILIIGTGLFAGQVGNSNAHELIHRSSRLLHRIGMWIYISVLFGHHTSAHPLVHHVHVGTRKDPNSARWGESLYRFAVRAWTGSFREGFRAESARLVRAGRPGWRHPYVIYLGGAGLMLALAALLGGAKGMLAFLFIAAFAQFQLLMSDYVQHYGLRRQIGPDGKPEPIAARHSWNSPHWFTSAMMLNAPRHSDHHAHPSRPYSALRLEDDMPMLPRSLPVMACVALIPPFWRKVMDPRASRWQEGAENAVPTGERLQNG